MPGFHVILNEERADVLVGVIDVNQVLQEIKVTAQANVVQGGCSCASVRYEAVGEPGKVTYCHCNSCRKATGAPVAVVVMFEECQFRFTKGKPRFFNSSPGVLRGFCPDCGTPLSWAGIWHEKPFVFVYIGTLDDPNTLQPDRHAFTEYQLKWFDTSDTLPRFRESSPANPL